MKKLINLLYILAIFAFCISGCDKAEDELEESPKVTDETKEQANIKLLNELDKQFESRWSYEDRLRANTAKDMVLLTNAEKEVFYYLNLARINPPLFGETYAAAFNGSVGWGNGYAHDERKASLLEELAVLDSLPILQPDEVLCETADCFATEGGKQGIIGHDRSSTGCAKLYLAECCHYGDCYTGYSIVMRFLVDAGEGNEALGHRRILLSNKYNHMGVAVRYHKTATLNAVLDFN